MARLDGEIPSLAQIEMIDEVPLEFTPEHDYLDVGVAIHVLDYSMQGRDHLRHHQVEWRVADRDLP